MEANIYVGLDALLDETSRPYQGPGEPAAAHDAGEPEAVEAMLVDLENHIRGALRIHGLRVGSIARGKFEARVRELLEGADWAFERMIDCMLEVRRRVVEGCDRLHTMVLNVVAADPVCRRFMSVPGIGDRGADVQGGCR